MILSVGVSARIGDAVRLAERMRELLADGELSVTVDLTETTTADVTLFQLLSAFGESLRRRGGRLSFRGLPPSHPVLAVAFTLGIALEGLPETEAAP